jgi:hypothetical protein
MGKSTIRTRKRIKVAAHHYLASNPDARPALFSPSLRYHCYPTQTSQNHSDDDSDVEPAASA